MPTPRQLDLINTPEDFRLIGNDHQTQLEAEALKQAQDRRPMDTQADKEPRPMTDTPHRLKDALIMLEKVAGDYNPWNWNLAGPRQAGARQLILSALLGQRIPKASAGVNALAIAFKIAGPKLDYTCQRDLEGKYHDWARNWLLNYKED